MKQGFRAMPDLIGPRVRQHGAGQGLRGTPGSRRVRGVGTQPGQGRAERQKQETVVRGTAQTGTRMGAALAFGLGMLCAAPVAAREITPAERREIPYDSRIPACDNPSVLFDIADRFAKREDRFWNSSLTIVSYEGLRQTSWRPWGLDYIPRRFCSGTVLVSDGVKRRIDFSVREDLGAIGLTWGTEWCIQGLDRNYAFAPGCKQARP